LSRCINHFFVCVFCPLGKRQFCSVRIILRVWRGVLSVVRRSVFPCHYMPPHLHFTSIPRFYLILVGFYLKPFDKVSGQYFLDLSVSDGWRRGCLAGAQQPRRPSAEIRMRCCVGCSSFFRGPPSTVLKQETHRPVMAQGKVRETEFSSFSPGQRPMG
jgi:hypothetical protein